MTLLSKALRKECTIPVVLMGYFNPILQYGVDRFCASCVRCGIDGVIIPDLPVEEYERHYQKTFQNHGLNLIFLITPQTPEYRIRRIDQLTETFIYMVSSAGTTGKRAGFSAEHLAYFDRVEQLKLDHPAIVGFGISNPQLLHQVWQYAAGAIVGSAFIEALSKEGSLEQQVANFIHFITTERKSKQPVL